MTPSVFTLCCRKILKVAQKILTVCSPVRCRKMLFPFRSSSLWRWDSHWCEGGRKESSGIRQEIIHQMKATLWVFERRRPGLFLTSRSDPVTVVIGCFSFFYWRWINFIFLPSTYVLSQSLPHVYKKWTWWNPLTSLLAFTCQQKKKYTLKHGEYTSTAFVLYVLPRLYELLRPRQLCLYVHSSFNHIIINLD